MIEIKNLKKNYGSKTALCGIDLSLPRGEIVGLFGENGAGKTTLMKCILNLLRYDGEITLDNLLITHNNIAKLSFATSEHSFFQNLTAEAHRDFYQMHFPRFNNLRFNKLVEFFELPSNRAIGKLSTGQKNQFEVILAVSQGADYIILDEPFAGNDVFNREDFYKVLAGILEPNESVLLSTHLIDEVESFIGRALLIHKGKIVGDVSVMELEESGKSLMDYVKSTYRYQADRVSRAISDFVDEE